MDSRTLEGVLFTISVNGSQDYNVYRHSDPGSFAVGADGGPLLAPVAGEDLLIAALALDTFHDPHEVEDVDLTTGVWGEGEVAEAIAPSFDKVFAGEFTVDGNEWRYGGTSFLYPFDFTDSSLVLASDSWSNGGQGMPGLADSGIYMLVTMGTRYLVVHYSEGSTSLEEVLAVATADAAINAFHVGWTSDDDAYEDDEE